MTKKGPFKTKPPTQTHRPDFYWRGGDSLREQEYIVDEYRKAFADYRVAQQVVDDLQLELNKKTEQYNDTVGYTNALASFLEGDPEAMSETEKLKVQLTDLEAAIAQREQELKEVKSIHNPAVASGLVKDKAYLSIECQRGNKSIDNANQDIEHAKQQMAAMVISPRYRTAVNLEFQLEKISRKRHRLRSELNRTKQSLDSQKPSQLPQSETAHTQRNSIKLTKETGMALKRAQDRERKRPSKYNNQIYFMLDQIDDLNSRMHDIGLEDEMVDTENLRAQYFGTGSKQEEEEANASNNDSSSNPNHSSPKDE